MIGKPRKQQPNTVFIGFYKSTPFLKSMQVIVIARSAKVCGFRMFTVKNTLQWSMIFGIFGPGFQSVFFVVHWIFNSAVVELFFFQKAFLQVFFKCNEFGWMKYLDAMKHRPNEQNNSNGQLIWWYRRR